MSETSTLQERLLSGLTESGINQSALANGCNVSRATVSDWVTGKIKSLSGEKLFLATDTLYLDARWLATGKGLRDGSVDYRIQRLIALHGEQQLTGSDLTTICAVAEQLASKSATE